MTIHIADGGPPIPAQLEEDEFHMLWLVQRNRRNSGRLQFLLFAALQTGWRIASASAEGRRCSTRTGSDGDGCSDQSDG